MTATCAADGLIQCISELRRPRGDSLLLAARPSHFSLIPSLALCC